MARKSVFYSVGHASDGLIHCLRTQKHMRLHFLLGFLVITGAALLQVSDAGLLALLVSVTLIVVAEMFNTGVEAIVDIIKPNYDPRAKIIKDISAGAVLLSGLNAALIGMLVFLHSPVVQNFRQHVQGTKYPSIWPELCAEAGVILAILTLAWKMKGFKGSVLRHGPISGRVAFGFFFMTIIVVNPAVDVRLASAAFMAMLIVQGASLPSRPYSVRQVVLGAILGILVPGLVFAAHFAVPGSGPVSIRLLHTLHDAYPRAKASALKREPAPKEVTKHFAP